MDGRHRRWSYWKWEKGQKREVSLWSERKGQHIAIWLDNYPSNQVFFCFSVFKLQFKIFVYCYFMYMSILLARYLSEPHGWQGPEEGARYIKTVGTDIVNLHVSTANQTWSSARAVTDCSLPSLQTLDVHFWINCLQWTNIFKTVILGYLCSFRLISASVCTLSMATSLWAARTKNFPTKYLCNISDKPTFPKMTASFSSNGGVLGSRNFLKMMHYSLVSPSASPALGIMYRKHKEIAPRVAIKTWIILCFTSK